MSPVFIYLLLTQHTCQRTFHTTYTLEALNYNFKHSVSTERDHCLTTGLARFMVGYANDLILPKEDFSREDLHKAIDQAHSNSAAFIMWRI